MTIIHVITAFGIGGAEKLLLNVISRSLKRFQHSDLQLII